MIIVALVCDRCGRKQDVRLDKAPLHKAEEVMGKDNTYDEGYLCDGCIKYYLRLKENIKKSGVPADRLTAFTKTKQL